MLQSQRRVFSRLVVFAGLAAAAFGQQVTSTSAANYGPIVSPDSVASVWGTNLAPTTISTPSIPLTNTLGNVQVFITDSSGATLNALLYMVSPGQVNFLVPANAALGAGTVTVNSGATAFTGKILISNVSPGLFTANQDSKGVAAGQILRISSAGSRSYQDLFKASGNQNVSFVANPVSLQPSTDQLYVMLYGTGIRLHTLNPVKATVNGVDVPVLYAGPQNQYPGLDQVNIGPLPASLAGAGEVNLIVYVDGVPSNTTRIAFQ